MSFRHRVSWKVLSLVTLAAFTMQLALSSRSVAEVVYHRGVDGDPDTLDPQKTSGTNESKILRDLFEGLVAHDAMGKLIPGIAQSWDVSGDGKTYTFHLRPNAKWSNGDPVQAADFVFSFRRLLTHETAARYASLYYPILAAENMHKRLGAGPDDLGVEASDSQTLVIRLERSTPYFLEILALQAAYPLHAGNVRMNGSDFVRPGVLVSNGSYTLVENIPNSHVVLRKNHEYYDADGVQIDTVYYHPVKDVSAGVRRFLAGELHSVSDFPTDQYKFLRDKLARQTRHSGLGRTLSRHLLLGLQHPEATV